MSSHNELPPPVSTSFWPPKGELAPVEEHSFNVPDIPEDVRNSKMSVPHPNGSEGWLPAEHAEHDAAIPRAGRESQNFITVTVPQDPQQLQSGGVPIQTDTMVHDVSDPPQRANTLPSARASSRLVQSRSASPGQPLRNSAFLSGAESTGPLASAEENEALRARGVDASQQLTRSQKARIAREEWDDSQRLSRIIKQEAKTEKEALSTAIRELENLQKVQQHAVKSEAHIQASHADVLKDFKKKEAVYLNAKRNYEKTFAELNTETETLETLRWNMLETTQRMQDKQAEVDTLRKTFAVTNREREVKLAQLSPPRRGFLCF